MKFIPKISNSKQTSWSVTTEIHDIDDMKTINRVLSDSTDLSISLRISSWVMPSFELPLFTENKSHLLHDHETTASLKFSPMKQKKNYVDCKQGGKKC